MLALALLLAAPLAVRLRVVEIPPRWNPWSMLEVNMPPDLLTRFRLARLSGDATLCSEVLARSGVQYERLADRQTGPGCGFTNAVRVSAAPTDIGEEFALSCRAAVSMALWERHVLQPAARRHFGEPVRRIEHFGSYACRNVYGRPVATRSRHATAEAWDVAGFVLEEGRRIRVASDWQGGDAEARFLREVRDGACRFFDGVLSPDYNAAHHDHFHLDRGPYRLCR